MILQRIGAPIPAPSVDVWQSRSSEPLVALVRTRAFAAVPAPVGTGGEVCPVNGVLGGTRPAGSLRPTPKHVYVDPFRPRPSGGPS